MNWNVYERYLIKVLVCWFFLFTFSFISFLLLAFHLVINWFYVGINSTESNEKNTPLHLACYHKHASSVEELLKRGADVMLMNENDETVLQYTQMGGSSECLALLKKYLD